MADNLFVGLGEALHTHYKYGYEVGMNRDATALTSPSELSVPKDLVVPKTKLFNTFDDSTFVTLDPNVETKTVYSSSISSSFHFAPALARDIVGVGTTFCSFLVPLDDKKPAMSRVFNCCDVFSLSVKTALEFMEQGTAKAFELINPEAKVGNASLRRSLQFPPKIGVGPKSAFNRTQTLRRDRNEHLALKQVRTMPLSTEGYSRLQKVPSKFRFRTEASGMALRTKDVQKETPLKNSIQALNALAREKLQAAYECSEKDTSNSDDKRSGTTKSLSVDKNSGKSTSTSIGKSSGTTTSRQSKESKGWRQLFTSLTSKDNYSMKHKRRNEKLNGHHAKRNEKNSSSSDRQKSVPFIMKQKNETGSTRTGTTSQILTHSEKGAESIKSKHSKKKLKSGIHESIEISIEARNSWGIKSKKKSSPSKKRRECTKGPPTGSPRRQPPKMPESRCTTATSRAIPTTKRGLKGSSESKRQSHVTQRGQHQDRPVLNYIDKASGGKRNPTMAFKRTIHPGKNQPPKISDAKRQSAKTPEPSKKAFPTSDLQVDKKHAYGSMQKPMGTKNRHSSNKFMPISENRQDQRSMPTSPLRARAQEMSFNNTTSSVFRPHDSEATSKATSKSVTWEDHQSEQLPRLDVPPIIGLEDEQTMTEDKNYGYRNRNAYSTVDSCGKIRSSRVGRPTGFTSANEVKNRKYKNSDLRIELDKESNAYSSIRQRVYQEKHNKIKHDAVRKSKYVRSDDSTESESESAVSDNCYMGIASPHSDFIQSRKSFSYFNTGRSEF